MTFIDHYKILNVNNLADNKTIRKSYHKLCLQWHPDKNKSDIATERFKTIQASYEILSDQSKRKLYDIEYNNNFKDTHNSKWYHFLLDNIKTINKESIKNMFYQFKKAVNNKDLLHYIDRIHKTYENIKLNKNHTSNNNKSNKTEYTIHVDLEDSYQYTEKEYKIPIISKCYLCQNYHNNLCKVCNGTIYYISIKIYNLTLSKQKYYLKNLGNHCIGQANPNDLVINLIDKPNHQFKRKGNFNLLSIVYYTESQERIYFQHINKQSYCIDITKNRSKSQLLITIDNLGLLYKSDNNLLKRGNLYLLLIKVNKQDSNYSKIIKSNNYSQLLTKFTIKEL